MVRAWASGRWDARRFGGVHLIDLRRVSSGTEERGLAEGPEALQRGGEGAARGRHTDEGKRIGLFDDLTDLGGLLVRGWFGTGVDVEEEGRVVLGRGLWSA